MAELARAPVPVVEGARCAAPKPSLLPHKVHASHGNREQRQHSPDDSRKRVTFGRASIAVGVGGT